MILVTLPIVILVFRRKAPAALRIVEIISGSSATICTVPFSSFPDAVDRDPKCFHTPFFVVWRHDVPRFCFAHKTHIQRSPSGFSARANSIRCGTSAVQCEAVSPRDVARSSATFARAAFAQAQ